MPGGLMTLTSVGNQNVILNGNPNKTFWKSTYQKYTNFGLQRFRLDSEGTPSLRLTEESTFSFKVKRYADLLMDCYISVALPNIWSPALKDGNNYVPYDFRWIDYIGAQMISQITVTCGSQMLQQYSGQYLLACVQRDYNADKKALFNEMIGHVNELNDPANANGRVDMYPSAVYGSTQPSIDGRVLYIPLGAWFNLKTQMALPLVALQYNELQINVTFRPINQLFRIRDINDTTNEFPYVASNMNKAEMQMYNFLQTPTEDGLYKDKRNVWDADVHLMSTYGFLSNEERRLFATNEQTYLFKQVNERTFYNVVNAVDLESIGLVSGWMFYFQRSDSNLRNEWSNYSNWPYAGQQPIGLEPLSNIMVTGAYNPINTRDILVELGILMDGQYRENMLPVGMFNYMEKFTRTAGNAPNGLYCYNFCLNTSPYEMQPSGAMNMSRYQHVAFEFVTINPPTDANVQVQTVCDPDTGEIIGINKPMWRMYEYNYNMVVFEERFNEITFVGGNAGLMYAT
jgi:hypothetical protein